MSNTTSNDRTIIYYCDKFNALFIYLAKVLLGGFVFVLIIDLGNRWSNVNSWLDESSGIVYLQAIFQFGAATSIAFAIAGPEISHALGAKTSRTIRYVTNVAGRSELQATRLKPLIIALQDFDDTTREYAEDNRGHFYGIYFTLACINILLLLFSSLVDPGAQMKHLWALPLTYLSIIMPLFDLTDVFVRARRVRPLLNRVRNACDDGLPEQIEAVCKVIDGQIKLWKRHLSPAYHK